MSLLSSALAVPGTSPWVYAGFVAIVLALLAFDLGVFNRKAHAPSTREAIGWTVVWVAVALLFGVAVYFLYEHHVLGLGCAVPVVGSPGETMLVGGTEATKLYITAYLVEKSLSMDNVFVIAMIFTSLGIPVAYQHRVLYWGILGALVMRGVMIGLGAAVVTRFSWTVYVFGGLLVVSALRMAFGSEKGPDPEKNRFVRLTSRVLPMSRELEGQRLVSHIGGRWHGTPLFAALIVIEGSDLMFAIDSIPAVFAITGDPFLAFTSNIMAILGLRALYFCLATAMTKFRYLKAALVAVLLFVGLKMCLLHTSWKVPAEVSLAVVIGLLVSGVVASLLVGGGVVEAPIEDGLVPGRATGIEPARPTWRWLLLAWRSNRTMRRVVVLTVGAAVLGVGIVIAPLPGPGFTILGPLGVAILASEFLWARQLAGHVVARERRVRAVVDRVFVRFPRILVIPAVGVLWILAWLVGEFSPLPNWLLWLLAAPVLTPGWYVLYRWHKVRSARRAARWRTAAGEAI